MTTSTLTAANEARTNKTLNKWMKDRATGEIYTHRMRIENGGYAYRVREIEDDGRESYGFINAAELGERLDYMTPVMYAPKLAYQWAESLPVAVMDHRTCRAWVES